MGRAVRSPAEIAAAVVSWPGPQERPWLPGHERFKHLMAQALGQTLGEAVRTGEARGEALQRRVEATPSEALARVLLAPNTAHLLLWTPAATLDDRLGFLEDALRAEDGAESFQGWTAQGERRDGDGFSGARLRGGALLDFDSPRRHDGDGFNQPDLHGWSAGQRVQLQRRIDEALALVAAVSPDIFAFVATFTRVLVPRALPGGFGSSSTLTYPGRTLVLNPDPGEGGDVAALAETLVHEAIHTAIYEMEADAWWVRLDRLGGERAVFVTSPWSGNALPLHAYVHACFVWYGLCRFWLLALEAGVLPRELVERRMFRCARGFLSADVCEPLQRHQRLLRRSIGPVCRALSDGLRHDFA